jgi:hypothetical protein
LLAVSRRHLGIAKQLLNEGGAQITDKNKGNTAISLAVSHKQLPIVDYLIRNYYLSSKLKFPELKLDLFSTSKAIHYYCHGYSIIFFYLSSCGFKFCAGRT